MNTAKRPIYPIESWTITEEQFDIAHNYRNETTFALSNGYIGTRGTFEEGYDFSVDQGLEGNYINGFYESENIRYGEWNYGFPETSQSLLNLPNLKTTCVFLDGEQFDMRQGMVTQYRRTLHMKEGYLSRELVWTSPNGKRLKVETARLCSFARKNIMAQRMTVTPLNFSGELRFESWLDAGVENHTRKTNPLVDYGPFGRHLEPLQIEQRNDVLLYLGKTQNSGLTMACGSLHKLNHHSQTTEETSALTAMLGFTMVCEQDMPVRLDKYMAYSSCGDLPEDALIEFVEAELQRASNMGFDALLQEQAEYACRFWEAADVEIDGDDVVQQGMRFNLFHIMQAAGRDGRVGMGAKGLSGEGYEGHYFWDTEIYILPVFIHTFPELARQLLNYRYNTLEEARKRARVLGHLTGALYPWRTINGQEASTYVPLGTAQYHINADVAYAFWQYIQVSDDKEYLKSHAAEVLCETARIWADVGCFSEARDGKYCICCVTGPDEYTAFVDNNFYTNLMARENIKAALEAVKWLKENDNPAYEKLARKIGLEQDELALWKRISTNMYLPYDKKRQVYLQDDGLLLRKEWDDSRIPPEKRHLLYENYHPLYLWRQRMAKQADSILGMYLHSHLFEMEEIRRNYDFYQRITLHHSSLSTCIFGILASRIGYEKESLHYFYDSARMELDDYHDNFYAGIHAANMAGTWQAIVNGFAGLRTGSGKLELAPYLPKDWRGYTFRIGYQGSKLAIAVGRGQCQVTLLNDKPASITLCGKINELNQKGDVAVESI